jgi:hypothetical protein
MLEKIVFAGTMVWCGYVIFFALATTLLGG